MVQSQLLEAVMKMVAHPEDGINSVQLFKSVYYSMYVMYLCISLYNITTSIWESPAHSAYGISRTVGFRVSCQYPRQDLELVLFAISLWSVFIMPHDMVESACVMYMFTKGTSSRSSALTTSTLVVFS